MLVITEVNVPDGEGWKKRDVWIDGGKYLKICRPGSDTVPSDS